MEILLYILFCLFYFFCGLCIICICSSFKAAKEYEKQCEKSDDDFFVMYQQFFGIDEDLLFEEKLLEK